MSQPNWQLIQVIWFDVKFFVFNVYGPSSAQDKLLLWEAITDKISKLEDLLVIGSNINAISLPNVKIGG